MPNKIKVLIVDDSALIRKMIFDALSKDPAIEVVGTAPDPYVARDKITELNPDVLTLDVEMPLMDGITFLKILQQHRPIPAIVISTLTEAGSRAAMAAYEAGAVEVLVKPANSAAVVKFGEELTRCVKIAAHSRPIVAPERVATGPTTARSRDGGYHPRQLIAIGSSTGGTEALKVLLTRLPNELPPIVIAQHIPAYFSRVFAERLNDLCEFEVREAVNGDDLRPGLALVAPGDFHMTVRWTSAGYRVSLNQEAPIHHCRPAVDALFNSVAACGGARVTAAILTGMGTDGALGMKSLKAIGARTMVQDEASCVVYGMPRAAVQLGVADQILPLTQMAPAILESVSAMADRKGTDKLSP